MNKIKNDSYFIRTKDINKMGVPQFFKWFTEGQYAIGLKDFDTVVEFKSVPTEINHLFIDFNAFIFDVFNRTNKLPQELRSKYENIPHEELENITIDLLIKNLKDYVEQINPSDSVGIFADGVVPMAKINSKRHSVYWKPYTQNMKKLVPLDEDDVLPVPEISLFGKIIIGINSPFMRKLFEKIFEKRVVIFGRRYFTLSGIEKPGEGEHKIASHIRASRFDPGNKIYIFSTDADMVFLSCLLTDYFIYISTRVETPPTVIDIFKFRSKIFAAFVLRYGIEVEMERFIKDFVFLCFFVGNDYLPHLPGYTVEFNGINILLSIYAITLNSVQQIYRYFVHEDRGRTYMNNYFLKHFFFNLANVEQLNLQIITEKRKDKYKIQEGWSDLKVQKNRVLYLNENQQFKKFHCPINYHLPNWKKQYRLIMMGVNEEKGKLFYGNIYRYLQGIIYCTTMYFDSFIHWDWFNQSYVAPLSSDIYAIVSGGRFDINQLRMPIGEPLDPILQDLITYPRYMRYFIPKEFLEILNNEKYNQYYFFSDEDIYPYEKDLITDISGRLPLLEGRILHFFKDFYKQHKYLLKKI